MSHVMDATVKRKRQRAESEVSVPDLKKLRASEGQKERHYHEDEILDETAAKRDRSEKKKHQRSTKDSHHKDRESAKERLADGVYERERHSHHGGHVGKERSSVRGVEDRDFDRVQSEWKPSKRMGMEEGVDDRKTDGLEDRKARSRHEDSHKDRDRGTLKEQKHLHAEEENGRDGRRGRVRDNEEARRDGQRSKDSGREEKSKDQKSKTDKEVMKKDDKSSEVSGYKNVGRERESNNVGYERESRSGVKRKVSGPEDELEIVKQDSPKEEKGENAKGFSVAVAAKTRETDQQRATNGSSAGREDGNGVPLNENGVSLSAMGGSTSASGPSPAVMVPGSLLFSAGGAPAVPTLVLASATGDSVDISRLQNSSSHDGVSQKASTSTEEAAIQQPGKAPNMSLDALAKARRVLEMRKGLDEKLKRLPQLNKTPTTTTTAPPSSSASPAPTLPQAALPMPTQLTQPVLPLPGAIPPSMIASGTFFNIPGMIPGLPGLIHPGAISNYEAVKRAHEIAVQYGFHQLPGGLGGMQFLPNMIPTPGPDDMGGLSGQPKTVKAPVLRLDAQGREIDEHGNIVDRPKITNLSTLKVNINKQKKEAFQILRPELDEDPVGNPFFDPRVGIDKKKLVRPKRSNFQFVEEGKWTKDAEIQKLRSQYGEAKAKEMKAKQAALSKAKAESDINPNLIEVSDRVPVIEEKLKDPIPDLEWWDAGFLPSKSYEDIADGKVKVERITFLWSTQCQ